jgi:quinol monooxygenase YgiN
MADVVIVSRIAVVYGRTAAFENVMAQNYRFLKEQPGFQGATLQRARNQIGVYLHYARWDSLESAAAAASQPFSRQLVQQMPLAQPLEPDVYEFVFDTENLPDSAPDEPSAPSATSIRF